MTSESLETFGKKLETLVEVILSETNGWTDDNIETPSVKALCIC